MLQTAPLGTKISLRFEAKPHAKIVLFFVFLYFLSWCRCKKMAMRAGDIIHTIVMRSRHILSRLLNNDWCLNRSWSCSDRLLYSSVQALTSIASLSRTTSLPKELRVIIIWRTFLLSWLESVLFLLQSGISYQRSLNFWLWFILTLRRFMKINTWISGLLFAWPDVIARHRCNNAHRRITIISITISIVISMCSVALSWAISCNLSVGLFIFF